MSVVNRFIRSMEEELELVESFDLDDPRLMDIFHWQGNVDWTHPLHSYYLRKRYISERAWAIASPQAIKAAAKYGPVVEIGAGSGWWASLIAKYVPVIAFDTFCSHNSREQHYTIHRRGSAVLKHFPKHTLFLCWPPYDEPMAAKALERYQGNTLVYVGEMHGCTADERFFKMLESSWECIEEIRIPQWYGLHDYMSIYRR